MVPDTIENKSSRIKGFIGTPPMKMVNGEAVETDSL